MWGGENHLPTPTNMEEETEKGGEGRHTNPSLQSRPGRRSAGPSS